MDFNLHLTFNIFYFLFLILHANSRQEINLIDYPGFPPPLVLYFKPYDKIDLKLGNYSFLYFSDWKDADNLIFVVDGED